jgi:periplasmic divalent cation tolerance protein
MHCTTPDRGSAETLARRLVEDRLVACVNIVPGVTSVFRWEGKVEEEPEHLLIIKTTAGQFEKVKECIVANHPYELAEIIAMPITHASPDYLKWLTENSK